MSSKSAKRKPSSALKRAVIYLRVSSDQQVRNEYDPEGNSLPSQRKRCKGKAKQLGAEVVREYVEPGVSGGSVLKREAFKQMLSDIEKRGDVDVVIFWSVSRWARDEIDQWTAFGLLKTHDVEIASASEPIDNSDSGLLLFGILGSIAAHERRKLGVEISRGKVQKVEVGGTPYRAPLGYLNVRKEVDGHEVRTVALDSKRASLVRLAFELYASGDYSLSELEQIMRDKGLRTRGINGPRRKCLPKPLSAADLQVLLRNDYYVGIVRNAGKPYEGRHKKLISLSLFRKVQKVLDEKYLAGERDRIHKHYLKGSLYCGECGRRLIFSRNHGQGGTYDYFICREQQLGNCSQRHRRAEVIEKKLIRYYRTVQLTDEQRASLRAVVSRHIDVMSELSKQEIDRAKRQLKRLLNEERKLLQAHYEDRISRQLFDEEQERITDERAAAEETVERLSGEYDEMLANFDKALALTENIQAAYDLASPRVRRMMNQAIFERIYVIDEDIDRVELKEPFLGLFGHLLPATLEESLREVFPECELREAVSEPVAVGSDNERTADLSLVGGSINAKLVELGGFEPPTSWVRSRRSAS